MSIPFGVSGVLIPAYLNFYGASKLLIGLVSALMIAMTPLQLAPNRFFGGTHCQPGTLLLYVGAAMSHVVYALAAPAFPSRGNLSRK